jgi:cation diffusion facilitator CzcD-associated flavoprotein CzcO
MPSPDLHDHAASAARFEHEVFVLGAGMSGLCMGVQLRRRGEQRFVIVEKSPGLGGTWWDNRYPGAHVDVPAPLYSFSFAPNPHWRRRFAAAPEIQAYQQALAEREGLGPHLRLGTEVLDARFDEAEARWHLRCRDAQGQPSLHVARYLVASAGPLSRPRWPDIPGLADFTGQRLHSARWDATVPLAGRRIGVIGTGSTACQLIPPLVAQAGQLTVFQRTPNWVLPRLDRPYTALDRALARLPPYNAAVRRFWHAVLEWGRRGFDEGSVARRGMLATAAAHLRRQVPDPTLRAALTPPYPLGCKRIIYANDYYPALCQPHVRLNTTAIEAITPGGVRTADGVEHALDVLVCATGFDVEHGLALPITGLGGQTLAQAWADGPQAQLGLSVAGFPNLFVMLGPNTATGHTSTLLYIEPGVQWALQAMAEVQRRGARWLALKPAAMAAFNSRLQARLAPLVWSGCRSWYRGHSGRNIAIWPGFTHEYVAAVRGQRFDDFDFG